MQMHPMVRQILANPSLRAAVERGLAARGQGGDTMIAHLNPHEAAMLRAMGGSGTINPRTGIRQFDPAGIGGGVGGLHEGTAESRSGIGGDSGGGGDVNASRGHVGTGNPVQGGRIDPSRVGTDTIDRSGMQAHSGPMHDSPYANASDEYLSRTFGQKLLDGLQGLIPGLEASKPYFGDPASYAGGTYHTGFNPGAAIGSIGGLVAGIPGLGTALSQLGGLGYNALGYHDVIVGGPGGIFGGGSSPSSGGSAGGFSGGAANGGLGGGLLGGAASPGGAIGGAGNADGRSWRGLLGGANGAAGVPWLPGGGQGTGTGGTTGQTGGGVPTTTTGTPAAAAPGGTAATPSLVPLMSQQPLAGDPFGGRFGAVPAFAQQSYQIGTQPDAYPIPTPPATNPNVTVGQGGQFGQLADRMLADSALQTALGQLGYTPTAAGTFPPGTLARILADPQALAVMRQMGYQV